MLPELDERFRIMQMEPSAILIQTSPQTPFQRIQSALSWQSFLKNRGSRVNCIFEEIDPELVELVFRCAHPQIAARIEHNRYRSHLRHGHKLIDGMLQRLVEMQRHFVVN